MGKSHIGADWLWLEAYWWVRVSWILIIEVKLASFFSNQGQEIVHIGRGDKIARMIFEKTAVTFKRQQNFLRKVE